MKRIKAVVKGRSNDEGFGLAVAVGFSLVAIMIGMTIVGRSLKDSGVSAAQKTTSRSLSAAEAGVTRYLSLINSDRYLARYPHTAATGDSWATSTTIPRGAVCPGVGGGSVTATVTPNQTANTWIDLDSSNPQKGQYRLISYTPPTAPATTGVLVVEGRISQRGTGSTASSDVSTGTTKLQVDIPVSTASSSTSPFPGLWLNQDITSSNKINADIRISCQAADIAPALSPHRMTGTTYTISSVTMPMPPIPEKVAPFITLTGINLQGKSTLTLPRSGDILPSDGIYRYSIPSIAIQGQGELIIQTVNTPPVGSSSVGAIPPQKVILYVDGDIDISGKGEISHSCKNTNGAVAPCNLSNLQIYAYNTAGASAPKICVGGNGKLDAFLFAPDYAVGFNGSGNEVGAISGGVWAKEWGCSNPPKLGLVQTGTGLNDLPPFPNNTAPMISSIQNWKVLPSSN
jgi:Tfp pilus assembly protein PilX